LWSFAHWQWKSLHWRFHIAYPRPLTATFSGILIAYSMWLPSANFCMGWMTERTRASLLLSLFSTPKDIMFETEPIRFLQTYASDWFTWFMLVITSLGSAFVRDLAISVILFGVSIRKGFLLASLCLWTAIFTDFCKFTFALQRPYEVDAGVVNLQADLLFNRPPDGSAAGFLQVVRSFSNPSEISSYSFPSGHASTATVLWGGLYGLFRSPVACWLALALIPLISFSRIYLGKHFLGDVIGGVVIGSIGLGLAHIFLTHSPILHQTIGQVKSLTPSHRRTILLLIYLLCFPLALSFLIPAIKAENIGALFGLNVAFLTLWVKGLPDDQASLPKRFARIALGVTTIVCVRTIIVYIWRVFDLPLGTAFMFFQASASSCFSILGTITLCTWLRLYETKR
jgi:membrane-associated phospholipid phosphatase